MACLLVGLFATKTALADTFLPSATGTTWKYQVISEVVPHYSHAFPDAKSIASCAVAMLSTFVAGAETFDGVQTWKYETYENGKLQFSEFLKIDDNGVTRLGGVLSGLETYKLDPPQRILNFPPRPGDKWQYEGTERDLSGKKITHTYDFEFSHSPDLYEYYETVGQESVSVPAGKFKAFHSRKTWRLGQEPATEDSWFVPDVGYVRIFSYECTELDCRLIDKQLIAIPKVADGPPINPTPHEEKTLVAVLADNLNGQPRTNFTPDTKQIIVRYYGEALKNRDKTRFVWLAEDVGSAAPKNDKLAEASNKLSRPDKGWMLGNYRVEIYNGDKLIETLKFTIGNDP